MGLATTLALLGVAASFAGKAYGQVGQGLPLAASGLAVIMGLNLLEVIEIQLPSFFDNFDPRSAAANFPSSIQAYLAGLTFALAASPCSTPVLATLLGYVAASKDPFIGGSLLLTYTTGYVAPLLLAASFAGALQNCTSPIILSCGCPQAIERLMWGLKVKLLWRSSSNFRRTLGLGPDANCTAPKTCSDPSWSSLELPLGSSFLSKSVGRF
ncbi:hypothetical protein E3N88_26153 [Mikania micrantha]|uniref:Cytochrome C biogenesis protein transmembrane domain-containing protein n=1 Tax=Mikania micrantha TaxID=192012 RepID=A0A5N6N6V9_9ASTR|nr:hypothetical protein E3N88_26153 [Mikania micrantha]